jgi:uncharacterized protein (DUF934 family)
MPIVTETGAFAADTFLHVTADAPLPDAGDLLLSLARWQAEFSQNPPAPSNSRRFAILVPNDTEASILVPRFGDMAIIAIAFPKYGDGRGFSLAIRLRRLGFRGRLRAHGPLISDQYRDARACGFDDIALPDDLAARQPEAHWQAEAARPEAPYQRGYTSKLSILDRRRAARQDNAGDAA